MSTVPFILQNTPELKEEVEHELQAWYDFHFEKMSEGNTSFDSIHFFNCLIWELCILGHTDWEDRIVKVYEKGWVDISFIGNLESVLRDLKDENFNINLRVYEALNMEEIEAIILHQVQYE